MASVNRSAPIVSRHIVLYTYAVLALNAVQPSALAEDRQALEPIRQVAQNFALEQAKRSAVSNPAVQVGRLDPRLRLTPCSSELEPFLPTDTTVLGNVTVGVRCSAPKPWTLYVSVSVKAPADIPVAARYLPRGTVLEAQDLQWKRKDLGTLRSGYLSDLDRLIGMRLKRPLSPGSVITPGAVEPPRLVRRGERVTILVSGPRLEVRAHGKALKDGAVGDRIPVRNLKSRTVIEGTVDKRGVVKVRL